MNWDILYIAVGAYVVYMVLMLLWELLFEEEPIGYDLLRRFRKDRKCP